VEEGGGRSTIELHCAARPHGTSGGFVWSNSKIQADGRPAEGATEAGFRPESAAAAMAGSSTKPNKKIINTQQPHNKKHKPQKQKQQKKPKTPQKNTDNPNISFFQLSSF